MVFKGGVYVLCAPFVSFERKLCAIKCKAILIRHVYPPVIQMGVVFSSLTPPLSQTSKQLPKS